MLRIGIDIDGTITEAHKYDILSGRDYCIKHNLPATLREDKIDMKDAFGWSDKDHQNWMKSHFPWNVKHCPIRMGASEVIRKLATHHTICIVTARRENYDGEYNGNDMKRDTYKYFHIHNIPVHEWYFSSIEKGQTCKENDIDLLIDDNSDHVRQCMEVAIPAICIAQPYNTDMKHESGVFYAENWIQIYNFIVELDKLKG